ncbi:PREDICTED: uncharacterized protein LOC106742684 [Dinoponera quadriceps]|uniref:Uncharacterized protein LOC106742684 n=1 Tax=Dinoponera quadriceps TaxID=609295 RepID=A0A6P3WZ29_DINQU|nr:PREDICTED: uncharacterized protein LOC106742684 [Dinoponera quadriceps]
MISNNIKTGRGHTSCAYEREFSEFLKSKHNIQPLAVCGSESLIAKEDQRTNQLSVDIISEPDVDEPETVASTSTENNSSRAINNQPKQVLRKNSLLHYSQFKGSI